MAQELGVKIIILIYSKLSCLCHPRPDPFLDICFRHLFQGRFKSIIVDGSRYLKQLVRYIHLNPVRAGIVSLPEQYHWCSHNTYLGTSDLVWVKPEYLLACFGDCPNTAVSSFQSFIHTGIGIQEELDFKRGAHDGILCNDDFVKRVREKAEGAPEVNLSISELIKAVCDHYKIDIETIK